MIIGFFLGKDCFFSDRILDFFSYTCRCVPRDIPRLTSFDAVDKVATTTLIFSIVARGGITKCPSSCHVNSSTPV